MPMAMKQKGRKIYRTMQGKQIDLDLLIKRNELTPAIGNSKVNARGDELGAGGRIIRKREEIIKEYYKGNAPVVNEDSKRVDLTQAEAELDNEFDDEWVEDVDGNFLPKK
jgi:hypothetical protein|tara:strand:+ start:220 stop:549 length:330 start_codon:yes stop_codon:yes gene_type:complete